MLYVLLKVLTLIFFNFLSKFDVPISISNLSLTIFKAVFISFSLTFFRVVAIEEPEAHLCPIVQRHLSKNLKDEENHGKQQLIITTHSTHIASYLDLDKMVVLFKNNEDVCSHYLLEGFGDKAEDKKIIRYLQKWLNATNSTMFFSRKIILVEGIAEEILIPIMNL